MKQNKFKAFLIKVWNAIKSPTFFIPTLITWLLLESPVIFGFIAYLISGDGYWLAIVTGWIALTAAPLPIPVLPISVAVGTLFEKLIKKKPSSTLPVSEATRGVEKKKGDKTNG